MYECAGDGRPSHAPGARPDHAPTPAEHHGPTSDRDPDAMLPGALDGGGPGRRGGRATGRTVRHRPNRGGNRQAKDALWTVALVRARSGEHTRAYIARPTGEGHATGIPHVKSRAAASGTSYARSTPSCSSTWRPPGISS
ncbi:hypothetical protein tb265_46770 [Gemmatimonadetes bacterium T265]|nr:hypothetical protein tb265_46770 [Gemmatimonadetes bacterium T265]